MLIVPSQAPEGGDLGQPETLTELQVHQQKTTDELHHTTDSCHSSIVTVI